ncbi:MAG TPA: hypothetical protein VGC21_02265 [Telluria sp.]
MPGRSAPQAAALRRHVCAIVLAATGAAAGAAPSTFGPVIGTALLCRSHLDNAYFQSYLTTAFGPSYKHEGGAYWFKADGNLWGAQVTDIILSDDTSELVFLGAVTEATPDKLEEAIRGSAGLRHIAADASAYPVRESRPGSRIVYFKTKSKIYCAKYKPLPILR